MLSIAVRDMEVVKPNIVLVGEPVDSELLRTQMSMNQSFSRVSGPYRVDIGRSRTSPVYLEAAVDGPECLEGSFGPAYRFLVAERDKVTPQNELRRAADFIPKKYLEKLGRDVHLAFGYMVDKVDIVEPRDKANKRSGNYDVVVTVSYGRPIKLFDGLADYWSSEIVPVITGNPFSEADSVKAISEFLRNLKGAGETEEVAGALKNLRRMLICTVPQIPKSRYTVDGGLTVTGDDVLARLMVEKDLDSIGPEGKEFILRNVRMDL